MKHSRQHKPPLVLPYCPPWPLPDDLTDEWVPLTPLEQMQGTEYDVLIVGSGAGGGAALLRLCQHWAETGKRIGMIERGGLLLQTNAYNIPTLAARANNYYYHPNITKPIGNLLPQFPAARQLFALGGRTVLWNAITPRIYAGDLARWPVPVDEMNRYYDFAEQALNVNRYTSPGAELMRNQLIIGGVPEVELTPYAAVPIVKRNRVVRGVYFSSLEWIAEARRWKPFDLAVQARAVEVLTDSGAVTGVRVLSPDKATYTLRAKKVILSCSTFETPRLLLASGIRNPALGHYLISHSIVRTSTEMQAVQYPDYFSYDAMPITLLIPQRANRPYQLLLSTSVQKIPGQIADRMLYVSGGLGIVEPRYENRVELSPVLTDDYGVPRIQVSFSYSPRDQAIVGEMTAALAQVAEILGLEDYVAPDCQGSPGIDIHEAGTCRIGTDPATSAADVYGQVRGVTGVFVADNSMLPSLGASNPTLTTVALSMRTADYIARQ